jgi:Ca-activated chloride channel family protein
VILELPAALWWLLLALVILLLYLLRTERRRVPVPSVRLWRGLGEELEARRNWRPPRWTWLLALQLAVVAVATLALAGPVLLRPPGGQHLVLLLDASASMSATDQAPTRFAQAQRLATERLSALTGGDRVTIIRAGAEPRALAWADTTEVGRAALTTAVPGDAPGNLAGALALAGAAATAPAGRAQIVVFSDGAHASHSLPATLAAPVEFVPLGLADQNVAVTALALRRPPNGGPTVGYARVANYAGAPTTVPVRLTADGLPVETRRLDLAAGSTEEMSFTLPPGTRLVAVQLEGNDVLAADNRAEARAPGAGDRMVTLVSGRPDVLARALRALPGVRVTIVAPEDYAGAALAPLVVFDGFLPRALPAADAIIVNPPAGGPLDVRGEIANPVGVEYDPTSPLLDAVDPAAFQLGRLVALQPPSWAVPVVWTADGPALLEGAVDGRRVVVLAFDPRASNLPRLRAFPLLLANALDRLGWGDREGTVLAGQAVRLPPNAGGQVVNGPAGEQTIAPGIDAYGNTERVGRYQVTSAAGQAVAGRATTMADPRSTPAEALSLAEFRVSLLAATESDVRPRQPVALPPFAPAEPRPAPALALAGLLLVGAIALSTAEWWWWGKGN